MFNQVTCGFWDAVAQCTTLNPFHLSWLPESVVLLAQGESPESKKSGILTTELKDIVAAVQS